MSLDTAMQQYFQYHNRLASFLEWPTGWEIDDLKPTPEVLARAGFFFDPSPPNLPDNVVCPYCNLFLDSWEPRDDPRKEHQSRSPNCEFVRNCARVRRMSDQVAIRPAAAGVARLNQEREASESGADADADADAGAGDGAGAGAGSGAAQTSAKSTSRVTIKALQERSKRSYSGRGSAPGRGRVARKRGNGRGRKTL